MLKEPMERKRPGKVKAIIQNMEINYQRSIIKKEVGDKDDKGNIYQ